MHFSSHLRRGVLLVLVEFLLATQASRSEDSYTTFFSSFTTCILHFTVFLTQKQYPQCKSLAEAEHFRSKVSTSLHWIHYTAIGLGRFLNTKIVYTFSFILCRVGLTPRRMFWCSNGALWSFCTGSWEEIGVLKRTLSLVIPLSYSANKPSVACSTCRCRFCICTVGRSKWKKWLSSPTVLMAARHMPWATLSHCVRQDLSRQITWVADMLCHPRNLENEQCDKNPSFFISLSIKNNLLSYTTWAASPSFYFWGVSILSEWKISVTSHWKFHTHTHTQNK